MEEKKNNKGLIWLVIILIVIVFGLVGFIVYDKVLSKDKTPENNNETTTTNIAEYIINETKISEDGMKIKLEQKINEDKCTLFINKKEIIIDYMISPDYNLNLHKNFIELWFFDPVGSKNNFYIYDYQGNLLGSDKSLNIVNQDYISLTKEEYYHYYYISDFKISDNKIEYSIGYFNDSCYIQGTDESPDNCSMSKFKCSDLKDLGENINYISTYEIELIDNKFSTPKLISSTKLKDTDVYKKAMNECE